MIFFLKKCREKPCQKFWIQIPLFSTKPFESWRSKHFRTLLLLINTFSILGVICMWTWTTWFHCTKIRQNIKNRNFLEAITRLVGILKIKKILNCTLEVCKGLRSDSKPLSAVKLDLSIVLASISRTHVAAPTIFPHNSYAITIDILWTNIDKSGWKVILIWKFRLKCWPIKNIT